MAKVNAELSFPLKGINQNWANSKQPPTTSPDMNNVRPYGTAEVRLRGGQRPGMAILYDERIGGSPAVPCTALLQVTTIQAIT